MKVRLARTAGFCMGVKRAVEMALEEANRRQGPIVTFGPLIHNTEVLNLLADKGIQIIRDPAQLTGRETAIIRAHGVPPQLKEELRAKASRMVDATCPRVVKVQVLIHRYTSQGFRAVIIGDADHAEVKGLLGHAQGRGVVINRASEVAALPDSDKVMVVAQTTQSAAHFQELVEALTRRFPQAVIHDTICPATHERQSEVIALARAVEGVVVVGGSFSANTQRLAQIAAATGKPVFAVEDETALDLKEIKRLRSVGVTAGASTPNWLIRKVVEDLRGLRTSGQAQLGALLFRIFRFLLKSNTLIALGGTGLALAGGLAQKLRPSLSTVAVPALYLYAMHVLNRFLDRRAAVYNDPDGFKFFTKHRLYLVTTALLAGAVGLVESARLGWAPLLAFALLSALGLVYPLRLIPPRLQRWTKYVKLKDLPGSKPLSIGLAWGVMAGLWPALSQGQGVSLRGGLVALLIAGLAFIRAGLSDVQDIQGDLVAGKETLAITLGEERSYRLLMGLGAGLVALAGLALSLGWLGSAGWVFSLASAGLGAVVLACRRKKLLPGFFLEGLVEMSLLAPAVLAWLLLAWS